MAQETHEQALQRLILKAGDTIKVLKKAESESDGWGTVWVDDTMDIFIGGFWQVHKSFGKEPEKWGVPIWSEADKQVWYFPAFVLEKVEAVTEKETDNETEKRTVNEPERTGTVVEVTGCKDCIFEPQDETAYFRCSRQQKASVKWTKLFDTCPLKSGDITIRIKK